MSTTGMGELRRGWRNLGSATLGIGFGIASYAPISTLFYAPMAKEFGWSQSDVSRTGIAFLVTALALPVAGLMIDRFGVRVMAGASAVFAVLGFIWLSRLGSGKLPLFYAAVVAVNLLGCATGPVAYTRLVAAQFPVQRGLALAVAQFGIAFITALMPQMLGHVIADHGWRGGYLFFAGVTAFGALAAQFLMKPTRARTRGNGEQGAEPRRALASVSFWLLGSAVLLISTAAFGVVNNFAFIFADRPTLAPYTADLLSVLAVAVMVSRLIVGRLLDTAHAAAAAAGVLLIAGLGAALLLLGSTGLAATALAVVLVGCSIGAELDLMSFFCARLFGLRHYASIYGLLSIFFYIGIAIGVRGYGAIRTGTGSYDAALAASAGLFAAAALLFLLLGRQRSSLPELGGVAAVPTPI